MGKIRGKWNEDDMIQAVQKVMNNEMSIREAAERFSVPKSSLGDRIKKLKDGKESVLGSDMGTYQTTFTENQENQLYLHVQRLDSQLMPMTKTEFLKLAFEFAEHLKIPHRFNREKQMAGKDFYYYFMKRHPELSLRTAESTSLQRAAGFRKEQVDLFFDKLEELMNKFAFSPSRIFNADETGVSVVHQNQLKVLAPKGKKQVGKLTSGERGKNVTVLLCINASGDQFIPPLFVFPRARIDNVLTKDAPAGSAFHAQPNGWICKEGFLKWLKHFTSCVNPCEDNPVLLIIDGHCSHKDLDVILYARAHHIHMLSLPPHTTHKLQPLDRALMKPFKNAYNDACAAWMRMYPRLKISIKDVSGLVNAALTKVCRMEIAQSAFHCTGIYPLNRNIFSEQDFQASVFNESETSQETEAPGETEASTSSAVQEEPSRMPVGTSMSSRPESCASILNTISPLPSMAVEKINTRKRRAAQSEILTSSPYKNSLELKKRHMDNQNVSKANKKSVKSKRSLNMDKEKEEKQRGKKENDKGKTKCIICCETFDEEWIQCNFCKGWAHIGCAYLDDPIFYKCDGCKKK